MKEKLKTKKEKKEKKNYIGEKYGEIIKTGIDVKEDIERYLKLHTCYHTNARYKIGGEQYR